MAVAKVIVSMSKLLFDTYKVRFRSFIPYAANNGHDTSSCLGIWWTETMWVE